MKKKLVMLTAYDYPTVKIEGYKPEIIHVLLGKDIKVIGHLGLLSQAVMAFKEEVLTEQFPSDKHSFS